MISQRPRALAIDWGSKMIGLAVGQTPLGIRPLPALPNDDHIWSELVSICDREQSQVIVVGIQADRNFVKQLKNHVGKPIKLINEELTSVAASHGNKTPKASPHSLAACLILEQYFSNKS